MNEALTWFGRVWKVLPELVGLWHAVSAKDEKAELEASLALRRKISDEQMREQLES